MSPQPSAEKVAADLLALMVPGDGACGDDELGVCGALLGIGAEYRLRRDETRGGDLGMVRKLLIDFAATHGNDGVGQGTGKKDMTEANQIAVVSRAIRLYDSLPKDIAARRKAATAGTKVSDGIFKSDRQNSRNSIRRYALTFAQAFLAYVGEMAVEPGERADQSRLKVPIDSLLSPARTVSLRPRDLRLTSVHFVGRDDVLEAITVTTQFVNIWGLPGSGKTEVASKWAADHVDEFSGGVITVQVNGYGAGEPLDGPEVARAILLRLGFEAPEVMDDDRLRFGQLTTAISAEPTLLVLDNVAQPSQVFEVLKSCGSARAIITSRNPMGALQADPGIKSVALHPLTKDQAWRYLELVIGRERVDQNRSVISLIVEQTAGLPVALHWEASRIVTTPGAIRAVRSLFEKRGGDHQYGPVWETFDASYKWLSPAQRRLLAALAFAPQRNVSQTVLLGLASGEAGGSANVEALVDRGLVDPATGEAPTLHDLVREFSQKKAKEEGFDSQQAARTAVALQLDALRKLRGKLAGVMQTQPVEVPQVLQEFDACWSGVQDCLAWARKSGSEPYLHWALTYHAGVFLLLKGDWRPYLREARVALAAVTLRGRQRWRRRLSKQLRQMRFDAMAYSEFPGFGQPARSAVRRVEDMLEISEYDHYWRRGPQLRVVQSRPNYTSEYLDQLLQRNLVGPSFLPEHAELLPSKLRERVFGLRHQVRTLNQLVLLLDHWALAPYTDAVSAEDEVARLIAARIAAEYIECALQLLEQNADLAESVVRRRPWWQARLSVMYGVLGMQGSAPDIAVVTAARDEYERRNVWVLALRLDSYLQNIGSVENVVM